MIPETGARHSFMKIAHTHSNIEVCLQGHPLENIESHHVWLCDVCGDQIEPGTHFWYCEKCRSDKCPNCHVNDIHFIPGAHVEITDSFEDPVTGLWYEGMEGVILKIAENHDTATIKFSNSCFTHNAIEVQRQFLTHLMVVDAPKSKVKMMIGLSIVLGLFIYGIVNEKSLSHNLENFVHWCKTLGLLAPVLIFLVCCILPVMMMPVFPMMALSGPLFTEMYDGNAWLGAAVAFGAVFGGLWSGSIIAFSLGKTFLQDFALQAAQEHKVLKRVNRIIDSGGAKIVFMCRSLPILPAEVFDYACAITTLRVHQYAIGCLGSAVPVGFWTFSSAQAAVAAEDTESSSRLHHIILIVINIFILVLLSMVVVFTIKRYDVKEGESNDVVKCSIKSNPGGAQLVRSASDLIALPAVISNMSPTANGRRQLQQNP